MTDHKSYEYARGVTNHEIPAPKYVIKQCEKFIDICDGKSEKYFDRSLKKTARSHASNKSNTPEN